MDRWLTRAFSEAIALDRCAIAHLVDVLNERVLPAVDRAVRRCRRLFGSPRQRP
jgi:hypothetical protein